MSLTPTDIIKNAAKHAENEGKTGYDSTSGVWSAHASPEGGLATIGYGHKGASSGEVASWDVKGLTDGQVNENFDKDWGKAFQIASNQYDAAYEDSFSDLPEIGQALLSEIAFNTGQVNNTTGSFGWPNLVKAIKANDVTGMKEEINRTYTSPKGVTHSMDRRVGFLRDAIDAATDDDVATGLMASTTDKGAPAPSGEDVGSIEALPDKYSHKIGDFVAGLMGGDQPTRNRNTQMVSDVLDWTPIGGMDQWNRGNWELERGNIGDGVLDTFMGSLDLIPGATFVTKPAKAAAKVVSKGANKAKGLMSDLAGEFDTLYHGTDSTSGLLSDGAEKVNRGTNVAGTYFFDGDHVDRAGEFGKHIIEAKVPKNLKTFNRQSTSPEVSREMLEEYKKQLNLAYKGRLSDTELSEYASEFVEGARTKWTVLSGEQKAAILKAGGYQKYVDGDEIAILEDSLLDVVGFMAPKSARAKREPTKTVKAYKLFRIDPKNPKKLYPLFVDSKTPVDVGKWVDAIVGPQVEETGKVKSKLGPLAFRPGWHGGDLPIAKHIGARSERGRKTPDTRRANEVWAEVEFPADVDWQKEANSRARIKKDGTPEAKSAHITDQLPEGGFYRYKTNPNMEGDWLISGSMKVNRVLDDAEVEAINAAAGVSDLPRATPRLDEANGWDWSTKKPQEFNTGGMVGMMTPTLEVIVGHDEESGNPIPAGSTDKEVRDDVEALLSEGEYVLPADVVRWHGLKHIQEMRDEAKCGLMCMTMDGQIKTPESGEDYEEPSDEDVEVTEEGNEIEIVDNTDEKKIKAADGGLIGDIASGFLDTMDSDESVETASLGYLIRRLVRGPSGRMEVRYFDPETGMYVSDPTGYEVLDQSAYNSLNGPGMVADEDTEEDTSTSEDIIEEASTVDTSSDKDHRYTLSDETNTPINRNQWNSYGFEDPNKLVTMGAGLLGGPLIGGAVKFGQGYNNAEAVDAAREDLGMEGLSWWDKVKGGFTGKYNNGAIGRGAIGENDYTAGFGGRVYKDEHGNDITTLTPNEWKKRTEAQNIDISTLPSASDSTGNSTYTPSVSSDQHDPWAGYGEAMQAKNDALMGLPQENTKGTTERSGFMSHFENPTAQKMFGKSYSDLTDDEKMATALRSQIDDGIANMAQGKQYEEIMARVNATNSVANSSPSTSTGDSGTGIMAVNDYWENYYNTQEDADTGGVKVSAEPHAEISGGNSINPIDPANNYYADLYGEEGRSTPGFLSPIDEIYLQEEMFLRDTRENDLTPAPSNDSDGSNSSNNSSSSSSNNSSSSSSNNSSSSKDKNDNSPSSSGGGRTQTTTPAEEDDIPSYTYDSSGRVGYGYGL